MTFTQHEPSVEGNQSAGEAAKAVSYDPCDNCGAPLDERQRYCVACGTRRKHAEDPAARFLTAATRRERSAAVTAGVPVTARTRQRASVATIALIAAIPIAVGVGVMVGRSSSGGDGKLIAALRVQKAPVIQYSGSPGAGTSVAAGTSTSTSTSTSTQLGSDFPLQQGFSVELKPLAASTDQAAADKAEKAARAAGASTVGLIAQQDFRLSPKPPAGDYVLYSGHYKTRFAAQSALGKLKHKFPGAVVIEVHAASGSATGSSPALTHTSFGTAHKVTGFKPNSQALSQGAQVAKQDSHSTGKAASGVGLPDQVAVP
jgi:hypothetical protein